MFSISMLILMLSLSPNADGHSSELLELRIHEGAKAGTRMTMGIEFQRKLEQTKNCFGQLETDVEWVEFRSTRGAFYTLEDVPHVDQKTAQTLQGVLHLLCTGNKMRSFSFHIHVTRKNRHPPTFTGGTEFTFYVPVTMPRGTTLGKLEVVDHDPVVYNSQRLLKFTTDQTLFNVYADGAIILKEELVAQLPYRPIHMEVLAIDYGSPQLFSIANVTVIPVTVSRVRELKVNVATDSYQIFEWDKPQYGFASKYRLTIRKGDSVLYEEELDSKYTTALTKVPITVGGDFTYTVTAIDMTGETPSETYRFSVLENDLICTGECSRGGGVPLCHYGEFHRLEQFRDERGAHCQCFHGYTGTTCQYTDTCPPDVTNEPYGTLDWPETPVNSTVTGPCPYNHDSETVERLCSWDGVVGRALWQTVTKTERCSPQGSVRTHLAMISRFAEKADTVSTVFTVVRFLRKLMHVPSFSKERTAAHFDEQIAEDVANVVNTVLRTNITTLSGNTTQAQIEMWSIVKEFSSRLPTPLNIVSSTPPGLHIRASHWVSAAENFRTLVGSSCYIKLTTIEQDNIVRTMCMPNATLFDVVDSRDPVLSLDTDRPISGTINRVTFGLRPFRHNTSDNYTCVYWDDNVSGWSTKGIRRISPNEHGFVVCEANHLSVFSILPESMFLHSSPFLRDFGAMLPTVTSVITIICFTILLFLAASQKGQTIDFALLFFLFFVFLIHCVHLLLILGPQIGDPFVLSPALHLVFQFCVLSVSATLCLLLSALHNFLTAQRDHPTKEEALEPCCSKPALTAVLGIVFPALLTFSTYYFANDYKHDLTRVFNRVDWLFLANYLCPAVLFLALAVAFAVWNIYIANVIKSYRRSSADRCLALSPAKTASVTALVVVFFLVSDIVVFNMRENSAASMLFFCMGQIGHCCSTFLFVGYLFRVRFLTEGEVDTSGSTRSLERKRDISRALLEHVDAKVPNYGSDISSLRSDSGHYLSQLTNNLYERQPMVSIV